MTNVWLNFLTGLPYVACCQDLLTPSSGLSLGRYLLFSFQIWPIIYNLGQLGTYCRVQASLELTAVLSSQIPSAGEIAGVSPVPSRQHIFHSQR